MVRWDELIASSAAETLYPYSWYLDAAAIRWSALVAGDYRFVMPLPWNRKFGIPYLYHPLYTQQLGIFSREYVDPALARRWLSDIYRRFWLGGVQFNMNNLVGEQDQFEVHDRSNYVLSLDRSYEAIAMEYSQNARRNIKRAMEKGDTLDRKINCTELVEFKRRNDVIRRTEKEYRWLLALLGEIIRRERGMICGIRRDGEILAAAFFGISRNRAIYLVSASSEKGKEHRGMFRIVDAFIRDHAGESLTLDFEGSDIPSLARFFSGFGARREVYQQVIFSRMPRFIRKIRGDG